MMTGYASRRGGWGCLACVLVPFLSAGCGLVPPGGSGTGGGGATLLEQLSLERINRARLRPGEEATASGILVDEGIPGQLNTTAKQPVALNAMLITAARTHSQDMLDRDYFEHNTPEGQSPFERMQAAGYAFTTAGENLAWRGTTGVLDETNTVEQQHTDLFVDTGIAGRGHRVTMLNNDYREVGIGILRGSYTQSGTNYDSIMQTQDYGTSTTDSTFILGVVYRDANSNGRYDYNEGVASSAVTLGAVSKPTNAAGGYSYEVLAAGTYTLSFASGASRALTIAAGAPNIKVDLVDDTNIVVNLGLGPLP